MGVSNMYMDCIWKLKCLRIEFYGFGVKLSFKISENDQKLKFTIIQLY
jgi:hypothetical protein